MVSKIIRFKDFISRDQTILNVISLQVSDKKTVVITSAVRTAIGSLGGTLKNIPGYKLGSTISSYKKIKLNLQM